MKKMIIQEYKKNWIDDFKKIKKEVEKSLSGVDVEIEHVGSTSIPDLAAKPIIDIDIVYGANVNFEDIKCRLEKLGYCHLGNQGIKEREVFKRWKSTQKHKVLDFINHHLYVCPVHSEELQRHIMFRDFLVKHKIERQQYEEIKHDIANESNQDQKIYARLKEVKAREFVDSIIKRAREDK